jgi:hypothetical protein
MIYFHGVDWVAAEKKIRQDAQRNMDRLLWGDLPEVMIIDNLAQPGRVYSRDAALAEWWRKACQRLHENTP